MMKERSCVNASHKNQTGYKKRKDSIEANQTITIRCYVFLAWMIHTHIHRNQLGSISEKIYYWGDECILCHSFYSFLIFEPFFFLHSNAQDDSRRYWCTMHGERKEK